MIHEIRLYTVVPGRLDVALERFREHLPRIFARHGIRNVGRWVATAGPQGPMFVYMMAYRDLAERESQWAGFYQDQEWYDVRSRTQGDEEATERYDIFFLRHNPAWQPSGPLGASALAGPHDLLFSEIAIGTNAAAYSYLSELYLPLLERVGAEVMLFSDVIAGPALPRIAIMLAWPDLASRQAGWQEIASNPELMQAIAAQRRTFGRSAIGRTDTFLLEPTRPNLPEPSLGRSLKEGEAGQ